MPIVSSTAEYNILFDQGKPLCFVGTTHSNKVLARYFSQTRECITISTEELEEQSDSWIQQHQFMCIASHPRFKYQVKELLERRNGTCFSVVGTSCSIGNNVDIGYNVFVDQYTSIWNNCIVGNHTSLTMFVDMSHGSILGECCQVGPYGMLSFVECKAGVYVGARSLLFGYPTDSLQIDSFVYLTADSRVLKSISSPGTYCGNRKIKDNTSLDY